MDVFNIIGPIMIGPSSSHTAGAVRLGRVLNKVMDTVKPIEVQIELSGSFAQTYKGHGTDRALLAGIMGYRSDSEEIRDALSIATDIGLKYKFILTDIPGAHPNTARIHAKGINGKEYMVEGASIGGENIKIDSINGMQVDFNGEHNTLFVLHEDKPGLIAAVTNLMRNKYKDVNIGSFRLTRPVKGGEALMTIEIDGMPPDGMIDDMRDIENVINVVLIRTI